MIETGDYFLNYEEWREAMQNRCRIPLTSGYCADRVQALKDLKDPSTVRFIELFGLAYRDKVIGWFERAGSDS